MTRAALVAAGAGVALALGGCSGDGSPAGSPASTARPATATPLGTATDPPPTPPPAEDASDGPPEDTAAPSVAVSTAAATRIGERAAIARGVEVGVGSVEAVQLTASAPGEIAGDGVSVEVTVRNASGGPVSLGGFAVTAAYGDDVPASPGAGTPLAGELAPGRSAKGTYRFSVPRADAGTVQVQVSSDASPTVLIFGG